ncbi:MAG: hypothetical protein ACFCD0_14080 [Gemmataceae bacterium]
MMSQRYPGFIAIALLFGLLDSDLSKADELTQQTSPLPVEWHGYWTGKMTITKANGERENVLITLKIEPIENTKKATWALTYNNNGIKSVRDYTIIPIANKPGHYVIDEGNGIHLNVRLVGGVLYSQFVVGKSFLTARYELRERKLQLEIIAATRSPKQKRNQMVQTYQVDVLQTATLNKA